MNYRPMKTVRMGGGQTEEDLAWDRLYQQANARLLRRITEHDVPKPHWMPAQDIAIVYRLPTAEKERMSPTGLLHIPDISQSESVPYSVGLLIFAGAEALGILENHGILPGDYVKFARYAGDEETAGKVQEAIEKASSKGLSPSAVEGLAAQVRERELEKKKLLELQVPFIHGSVDLLERMHGERPTMEIVREVNAKGEMLHVFRPIVENIN